MALIYGTRRNVTPSTPSEDEDWQKEQPAKRMRLEPRELFSTATEPQASDSEDEWPKSLDLSHECPQTLDQKEPEVTEFQKKNHSCEFYNFAWRDFLKWQEIFDDADDEYELDYEDYIESFKFVQKDKKTQKERKIEKTK